MTGQQLLDRLTPHRTGEPLSVGANTVSLAAARIAPMLTGFGFWAAAAIVLPPARLGTGSALVSAALLVVQLGLLGVGPATVTLLPARPGPAHRLVTTSLAVVAGAGLVASVIVIAVTRALGGSTGAAWSPSVVAAFLAAAVLATVAYQLDHVAVAQARSQRALTRSILQGITQLAALGAMLAAGSRGVLALLLPVAAGAGASVLLGLVQLARAGWRPQPATASEARLLVRHGLPNYALILADRAPGYLLPLVVAAAISARATAAWYLVWMLTSAVFFVPQSAGYSLQAHLAAGPSRDAAPRRVIWSTLRISLLLTLVSAAGLVLLGPVLLSALGDAYVHGWQLLPVMAPGLLVGCVTQVYYGVCRAQARLTEATAVAVAGGIIVIAPAAWLASRHGLTGVSWLWVAGQGVAAALATWRLDALTRPDHLRRATAWARRHGSVLLAATAGAAAAAGLWSLAHTSTAGTGPLGLAPLLHAPYLIALAVAVLGPVLSLRRHRQVAWVLAVQLAALIVLLHGLDPVLHDTPRLEASYRHLGIASYIAGTGHLDPRLDAYFSWPGLFALLAMLSGATGARTLMAISTWTPIAADLLLLPPVLTIARRLTPGWRHAWAATWLWTLLAWVGQDYLSPQAFALQLALTVLAVVLTFFTSREGSGTGRWRRLVDRLDPGRLLPVAAPLRVRIALIGLLVLLLAAIVCAHQLTPFALAGTLIALTVSRRVRLRNLPVLAVLLPLAWLVLVATPYLVGHEATLFGSLGNLHRTTSATVAGRVAGDAGHRLVVDARLLETAAVWVAAVVGAARARRARVPWLAAGLCVFTPALLLPLQPYGGELLLRVYLYGLPFAAALAATVTLGVRAAHRPSTIRVVLIMLVGLAVAATTLVTRYGNDAMETFDPAELALVNQLYAQAPPGSTLIQAVHDTPWQDRDYATYTYRTLLPAKAQATTPTLTCSRVDQYAAASPHGAYLIVTTGQERTARLLGVGRPGDIARFVDACRNSPGWTTEASTPGGTILHIDRNAS